MALDFPKAKNRTEQHGRGDAEKSVASTGGKIGERHRGMKYRPEQQGDKIRGKNVGVRINGNCRGRKIRGRWVGNRNVSTEAEAVTRFPALGHLHQRIVSLSKSARPPRGSDFRLGYSLDRAPDRTHVRDRRGTSCGTPFGLGWRSGVCAIRRKGSDQGSETVEKQIGVPKGRG